jgi:hypothetical protein
MGRWGGGESSQVFGLRALPDPFPTIHGWARAQATLLHPANMQRISFSLFDVNMEHGVSQFILYSIFISKLLPEMKERSILFFSN